MATVKMRKVPPDVHHLTETDHLPSVRHLRVQVVTNSKGYVELNLNNRGMRIVPPETFQLINTQVLRLAQNYIDYLPTMIAYLRGLRVLDLQRNVLVHLPETLVNCKHLGELRLTGNRLATLPRSFGGLKNLRILELGENQLEQLPHEVGLLHSLRTLDLHSNRLWHLPFSLQELRHLLNLNLSDNMFDHVPLVVTKITSIRALNLSRNRLGSLPLDMDALKGLRELNLSHNKLASISSVLVTLTHLKYLSLAHNGLKFLPSRLSQLQNLRVLHLQDNELRHVPSCLRRLRFYNVSSNKLNAFSVEGMRALVSITASKNRLETVPRGLYKLKQLKFLTLDCNALVEVGEEIVNLKQLKALNLAHNNLQGLPKALHELPLLQNFNIKGNYSLTKRKSQKSKKGGTKLDEEKYKEYVKTMKQSDKKKLLSRRGALEFKEDENENDDDDENDDDVDNEVEEDEDDDDDDEGIWMSEDLRKSRNATYKDVLEWNNKNNNNSTTGNYYVEDGYHGKIRRGGALLSRSAKSLDELNREVRRGKNGLSYHRVAGELAGRSVERKRRNVVNDKKRQTNKSSHKPSSSKMFLGRGVALPSSSKQTTMKRMTSSNFASQQSSSKRKVATRGSSGKKGEILDDRKVEKDKSKMLKGLKEFIFGTKSRNDKPRGEIRSRGYAGDTKQMKTSNSVNLPLEYTADEVDGDWTEWKGSRVSSDMHSGRNYNGVGPNRGESDNGMRSVEGGRSLEADRGDVIGSSKHRVMTRAPSEGDVRDWKSVSHGYGSWRSRTQMLWEIEENSLGRAGQLNEEVVNMDDETRMPLHKINNNRINEKHPQHHSQINNNKTKLNKKKSLSSDTVASDFTYQKFGGKPDRAPSRHSSNASRYRIEKRTNNPNPHHPHPHPHHHHHQQYYVTRGNDRYSVMSGHGSMPRPSSRSKWLGQWYGPDYESSFTVGSDEDTEGFNRSYDYSVREAKASFATDTTMGTHSRHRMSQPHPLHGDNDGYTRHSNPDLNYNSKYHYRPVTQRGSYNDINDSNSNVMMTRKHSSIDDSLHISTRDDTFYPDRKQLNHYTGTQEFPPFHNVRHYPRIHSNWLSRDNRRQGHNNNIQNTRSEWSGMSNRDNDNTTTEPQGMFESDDDSKIPDRRMQSGGSLQDLDHLNAEKRNGLYDNINNPGINTPERDGTRQRNGKGKSFSRSKSFHEFDNVLTTNEPEIQQAYEFEAHQRSNTVEKDTKTNKSTKESLDHLDDNFALRKKSELPRSKSMNSLHDPKHVGVDGRLAPFGMGLTPLPAGYGTLARGASMPKPSKGEQQQLNRTDYTLLGVCNQIETMLNKNLLQPVIGFKASHRFEDKTIEEKSKGVWRIGDSFDRDGDDDDDDDDDDDNNDKGDDNNNWHGGDGNAADDGKLNVLATTLKYSQPQTFKVTSTGGQFMTCERPEVKVTVPAHSVNKSLQVTIQMLNISPSLLTKAKRLNHFIDNIVAIGPVVYFYLTGEQKLNSPVSFTLPAPASVKGSHLAVLTIRRDNSCMPCNSGFRSSKLEVSMSAWHFTAKVSVLTKAKCKYKACKSVELLLQCIGANQV